VFSQEAEPERFDIGNATTVRPDVGGLLPTFVLDHYEGYDVKLLQDCTREELDAYSLESHRRAVACEATSW
jgi:acetyl-CoA acetyltransferase